MILSAHFMIHSTTRNKSTIIGLVLWTYYLFVFEFVILREKKQDYL